MLADPSLCHHPPLWNCIRCGSSDASPCRLQSLPGAKRVFKAQKLQRENRLKVPECAAASSESSAEHSTGTLAKPSPELYQKLWTMDSAIGDSLPTESPCLGSADRQSLQIQDEDSWQFRNGPLPGDLAEVEAFCRIFRIAEQLHSAVMEALCSVNDDRECSVSTTNGYDLMSFGDFEIKDVPLLEEKVVSGLGCIGALLHQQKQEVLGARFSGVKSTPFSPDDSIPPLAQLRAEMKRCCEQLEAALCCYFPPVDEQFKIMHSKFQRLQNACFDAGFPRPEGSPSHADIPNWAAVRLRSSRGDRTSDMENDVMFWRGGQVTEMGVKWLIDKGFKVVADLRAENSVDQLAKSVLGEAVSLGKLRHVRLPVHPGKSPTKEQVMEFANLVADPQNHPLYLHSLEGVGRTSAMVMRWREIALRKTNHLDPIANDILNENVPSIGAHKEVAGKFSEYERENCLPTANKGEEGCLDQEHVGTNSFNTSAENNAAIHSENVGGSVGDFLVPLRGIGRATTPFEAQRPPLNIFSRQAMSKFFKGGRVSPSTFEWNGPTSSAKLASARGDEIATPITDIVEPAGRWGLDGPGIPRAGRNVHNLISDKSKSPYLEDDKGDTSMPSEGSRISSLFDNGEVSVAGDRGEVASQPDGASLSVSSGNNLPKGALLRVSGVEGPADDTEEPGVIGDMCASTTGVVRIQSRRKAEMFLVRTDGFSCTRERVKESTLAFTHPSTQQQMLMWKTAPKTVLLLKKLGNELMNETEQVASFLHYQEGMDVVVERDVHDYLARFPGFGFVQTFYNQDASNLHERVDFVVCLGGDGVILHASNLFRDAVPPVVSFNLGSLGFLTTHPFEDFMQDLRAIIHGNSRVEGVYITLRMRLRCELFHDGKPIPGKVFDVLNEVVVDRGSSPYLSKIECYERNRLITKVQADGVIVATPTGSTAYSTAAGGSMVHPNVPCMLFTPICPHSLSFRPVILPDSALLELKVPKDARSNAWVSFDGKKRQQLSIGDSVRISMSEHPLPTVNKSDQTDDWFRSLVRCLNWNERMEQKVLTVSS